MEKNIPAILATLLKSHYFRFIKIINVIVAIIASSWVVISVIFVLAKTLLLKIPKL